MAVFAARVRPGGAQYALEESTQEDVPTFGIVQNWPYRDLPEALDDPAVDRVFAELLARRRPDLVAVQTLAGLSLGVLDACRKAGVPVVVHLHDGWWSCPSGGQRLHPDGTNCLPVDRRRCGDCFARFRATEGPIEAWSRRAAGVLPAWVPPDALHRAWNRLPTPARSLVRSVNQAARRPPAPPGQADEVSAAISDRAERVTRALADVELAVSPTRFLAESLAADGVQAARTAVVSTGVPVPERSPPSPPRERALRLLFLGTWVPHKGLAVVADALAGLPPEVASKIDARAHGPVPFDDYREDVLGRARGRLVDGGVLAPDAVGAALDAADVVVVPSIWAENAPLVALEARARGRVVVASNAGGLPELVGPETGGSLLPPGDVAAWAEEFRALAEDRSEVLRRAEASRGAPPRSVPEWVDEVEDAWASVGRA